MKKGMVHIAILSLIKTAKKNGVSKVIETRLCTSIKEHDFHFHELKALQFENMFDYRNTYTIEVKSQVIGDNL